MNIGTKLNNAKFGQQMQNDFSRKLKQILKLFTKITHILELPINLFWSLQKVQIEPLSYWMLVQGSKMSNLVDEYKIIFWETEANLETSRRLSPYNGVSYKFFEIWKKPESNLRSNWILVQGFQISNLLNERKTIFLEKRYWLRNFLETFFPYWNYL